MNKNTLIAILVIIIIVLAGALGYFGFYKKPQSSQNPPPTNLQTYKNGNYNFEFQYPDDFSFVTPSGYSFLEESIVQIQADGDKFPGTNLADYAFDVSNQYNYPDCLKSINSKTPLTETQTINSITFYKDETSGAAAGNIYDSQIYRAIKDNWCFEIALTVHTGNIGNYTPGTVTEVDKNKVFGILNEILATFKFVNISQ